MEEQEGGMTEGPLDKTEVARRQLDGAIRLLLKDEDSLIIHNAAYDAYSVLRDLMGEGAMKSALLRLEKLLRLREVPEYMKHAYKHPDDLLHDHSLKSVHLVLALGMLAWKEHGYRETDAMREFSKLPNPYRPGYRHSAAVELAQRGPLSDAEEVQTEVERISTLPSTGGKAIKRKKKD